MADIVLKHCGSCNTDKPIIEFDTCSGHRDGRQSTCRDCHRLRNRKSPEENRRLISKLAFETGTKKCSRCKKILPIAAFRIVYPKNFLRDPYLSARCQPCCTSVNRERVSGITEIQSQMALQEQNGICKLCDGNRQEVNETLCTDHCHKTKIFRGMLCKRCNTTVENHTTEFLLRAAEYVRTLGFNSPKETSNDCYP